MQTTETPLHEQDEFRPDGPAYEVGYKRPPIASRFKKGKSGNPRGRPRAKKAFSAMLREALHNHVRVREGDQVRARPKIEAAIDVAINQALKGDMRALMKLIDLAHKHGGFDSPPEEITEIREIIIDPKAEDGGVPTR